MTDEEIKNIALLNKERIERLLYLGVLFDGKDNTRSHNIGVSDYAERTIQAWSVWMDWELDPWESDVIKRVGRHKKGEDELEKWDKIEHIAQEKKRQLMYGKEGEVKDQGVSQADQEEEKSGQDAGW